MKYCTLILVAAVLMAPTTALAAPKKKPPPPPPVAAGAKDCRISEFVDASAKSLAANTQAGGHVSIHVKGQKTQDGKSQFASEKEFVDAFAKWKAGVTKPSPVPKPCGGKAGSQNDCVPAEKLGITDATVCEKADAQGKCTKEKSIKPKGVGFWYKNSPGTLKKGGTAGIWILNTAYPSEKANCM